MRQCTAEGSCHFGDSRLIVLPPPSPPAPYEVPGSFRKSPNNSKSPATRPLKRGWGGRNHDKVPR